MDLSTVAHVRNHTGPADRMPSMPSSDPSYVAAALDSLFDLPIDFQPDIDEVIDSVDPPAAKRHLLERLRNQYERGDSILFQELLERLGTNEIGDDLRELFRDPAVPLGARACALEILSGRERETRLSLLSELDPGRRDAIIDEPLRELIADAIEDGDAALSLAFIAEHFPESRQIPLEEHIELLREQMGATAATVYEPLLCSLRLERLHESMIEALVSEHAPDARHALECALEAVEDREARDRFEDALRRLDEAPPANPIRATARLGPIDGPGRFEMAVIAENPDRTRTLAFLLVDGEGILDGFVDFDPPAERLESNHLPRVEVPPAAVAELVAPALQSLDRDALDSMTLAAVRYFERLPEPDPLPLAEPAREVEESLIESLMERNEYLLWAFTPEDFHRCDIPEPPPQPDGEWVNAAMKCLDQPDLRARVRRDVEFMSRWHLAAGEATEASALARIAAEIEEGFATHPLVRAMVSRSVEILYNPDLPDREVDLDDGIDLNEIHEPDEIDIALLFDVVDTQISAGDPKAAPEVFEKLLAAGLSENEAKRRMVAVLEADVRDVIDEEKPHDPVAYETALRRLVEP
jgi:hypothetical protein